MSPESLNGDFSTKSDMWSLGVTLYIFISDYMPFDGDDKNQIIQKIKKGKFDFRFKEFNTISYSLKELISQLLTSDPKKRISAEQALAHPWFSNFAADIKKMKVKSEILNKISGYKGVSKLKQAALHILINQTDQKQFKDLRKQFDKIDKDGTGLINAKELMEALIDQGQNIDLPKCQTMIDELDYHQNGKINYSEFLIATIDM